MGRTTFGDVAVYHAIWDDLRFPAQAIGRSGAAADPDPDTTTGLYLFDAASTESLLGVAQMPHSWREGSVISPHVHWQKTTSAGGNVLWRLEYEVVANGGTAALDYGTSVDAVTTVAGTPDSNTANEILISSFGEIDMTGFGISCIIFWKLSRIGGDETDTYAADARLVEFDIHYQVDTFGSDSLFTKTKTLSL